jgi:aryl-alcohol dehydrogenase-like predicted oxidoreductase
MMRGELSAGYDICRIINGGWQLSAGHRREAPNRRDVIAGLVRMAQAGLTTFDCADIYTGVEELFGDMRDAYVADGGKGEDIQIHTKFVPDRDALREVDRSYVERLVDRSLTRLGVSRLDLVQFHWWDYDVPGMIDAAGHLTELRSAGKIREIGVTNFNTEQLKKLFDARIPIVSAQVQYSLLDRRPEKSLAALCQTHNAKLLCYGSLAGGFLTGQYLGAAEPTEQLSNRSLVKYRLIIDEAGGYDAYQNLLSVTSSIAGKHDVSIANVASRFALQQLQVASVIIGATGDRHLEDTVRTLKYTLDPDDMARLHSAVRREVPGDCFDLERVPDGPHQRIMKMNLNE